MNMRNLLFGCYMPPPPPNEEGGATTTAESATSSAGGDCVEVTVFDAYEKVVQQKIKKYNEDKGQTEVAILPIRYKRSII